MNFLSLFKNTSLSGTNHILKNPGDSLRLKITPTNRFVANANISGIKLSRTVYPTGRVVETRSFLPK